MSESVYKVIELVGTSGTSWTDAARNAVETAGNSLKELRIADISRMDMRVDNGKVTLYRTRVSQSFKVDSQQLAASVNKLMGSYP